MADKLSITEFHRKHSQISLFHHSGEIEILSFIVDVIFEYRIYNHWTYPHFSGFEVQLKKNDDLPSAEGSPDENFFHRDCPLFMFVLKSQFF